MMRQLRHWLVETPLYTTYYSYESLEPPEEGLDCVFVEAFTKREALKFGRKKLEEEYPKGYISYSRQDGENPFTGLKASSAICKHGIMHFCGGIKDSILPCEPEECKYCDFEYLQDLNSNPASYAPEYLEEELKRFKETWHVDVVQLG